MNSKTILLSTAKLMLGGFLYYMMEVLTRGYSHWTMFLLGGLCFLLCGMINKGLNQTAGILEKMSLCMVTITLLEFITGIIVNGLLHWKIWNYSQIPFNVLGQICVPYMLVWYFLSCPVLLLNKALDKMTT